MTHGAFEWATHQGHIKNNAVYLRVGDSAVRGTFKMLNFLISWNENLFMALFKDIFESV